ncbi:hypothetical protein SH1V18_21430 [Vallitalea longa]|uniref:DUF4829 domain-containing protein n=1 Tax=Vallitalea longa TaxID=2936439 RepID=A0A9W5YC77_9FIRM|nr:DUF4829 domain-containing protein [Vallitalea longa]GKX29663.1 hypothetical protein SH1V18_21430 [Vallitalea longa]
MIKNRFRNLLNMKFKRQGKFPIILFIFCLFITSGLVACNNGNSTDDATTVVKKYLEAQKDNNYDTAQLLLSSSNDADSNIEINKEQVLSVISLSVDNIEVSDKETQRIKNRYIGSEIAISYDWTDEYINENMIAVFAEYNVDYDNTKVPYNEGDITQYFYLIREDIDSSWLIWDQNYEE